MEALEFGARIRQLRKEAGMTQRELADKINIDFTYLSKIECGTVPPPSEKVISRLAKILNVGKDELLILAGKFPSDIVQILKNKEALQHLRAAHTREIARSANKERRTAQIAHLKKRFKGLSRLAMPITLVLAIATSLFLAAPLPVKALEISVTNTSGGATLPGGTLGNEYAVKVIINVQDMDLLPVVRVDVRISNASDSSKTATLENLPLLTVSKQVHTLAEGSSSGSASIAATTAAGWGPGDQSNGGRTGYGYGYTAGWGYISPSGSYGYGYGYGDYHGTASITYTVYWTPPTTSAWAGTYKVQPIVYSEGTSYDLDKAFTVSTIPSFTVTAATADDAAPAVAIVVTEPGVTDVSDIIDEDGVFTESVTAESEDAQVTITIDAGITGLTTEGEPISEIVIVEIAEPPAPPEDVHVIGLTYDIFPDGATFDEPVTITLTYDPDELPEGVNEEDLVIAVWDEDAGEWVELDTIVDPETNTISIQQTHFSKYAIFARVAEVEPPVVEEPVVEEPVVEEPVVEEPVVEEPVVEEPVVEEPVVEEPAAGLWWIWIIVGVVVVGGGVYWFVIRPRIA